MSERDTAAVMRRYLDALLAGDLPTITDSFAEDATWRVPGDLPVSGTVHGRDAIVGFLLQAGGLFAPGSQKFDLGVPLVEGAVAVLEWSVTGTGTATGLPYDNRYCGLFEIRAGRIQNVREYFDTAHFQRVLIGAG